MKCNEYNRYSVLCQKCDATDVVQCCKNFDAKDVRNTIVKLFRESFSNDIKSNTYTKELVNELFFCTLEKANTDKKFRDIVTTTDVDGKGYDDIFEYYHIAKSQDELIEIKNSCIIDCRCNDKIEGIKIGKYDATIYYAYQDQDNDFTHSGEDTWHYHVIFHLF